LAELIEANRQSKGPGHLLGEAIKKALFNTAAVGGFIIIFSVLATALSKWGVIVWLAGVFKLLGASYPTSIGIGMGCFEMTLGSQAVAASSGPLLEKLLAASGVLAWSGLSIQAQVMSLVSDTPIRYLFYVKARLLQTVFAMGFTLIGFKLWSANELLPAFYAPHSSLAVPGALEFLQASSHVVFWSMVALLLVGLCCWLSRLIFLRYVH
jgi:hypothetical protein